MKADQKGFTLVEAMVAIVILTMSLFATYSWVNVSIEMLLRSDAVMKQGLLIDDLLNELAIADTTQTEGEIVRKNLKLVWRADLIESRAGRNNLGAQGYFDHSLYKVTADIYDSGGRVASYQTRQVRSIKAREPKEELTL